MTHRGAGLVLAVASAAAISAAAMAVPALAAPPAGALLAWGSNSGGQLGDGGTADAPSPVSVSLPSGASVTAASVGSTHALAVTAGGQVLAWGTNSSGQLGNGTETSSTTPVQVSLPSGTTVTAVSAGTGFSLALTSAGQVLAWGANSSGQLGDGTGATRTTPVAVHLPSGTQVTAISAGTSFGLALTSGGQVLAWGGNRDGELGNGSDNSSSTPVQVALPAGTTATGVAAGGQFGLAATSAGQALAWGTGSLGNGSVGISDTPVPVSLPSGTTVTAVSAGGTAGYALTSAGQALAWGTGTSGQLGTGATASAATPVSVEVPTGTTLSAIAGAAQSALALTSAGTVLTWGTGDLGAGSGVTSADSPVSVSLPAGLSAAGIGAGPDAVSDLAVTVPGTPPVLECQVITSNGTSGGTRAGTCGTAQASATYVIDLGVSNGTGSFAWTVPPGTTVVGGCSSAAAFCDVSVRATHSDQSLTTTVVTGNAAGSPVTLSATAEIPAVCGTELC
jgi:alpha-tubulin suppressor-like RCC1 family protein